MQATLDFLHRSAGRLNPLSPPGMWLAGVGHWPFWPAIDLAQLSKILSSPWPPLIEPQRASLLKVTDVGLITHILLAWLPPLYGLPACFITYGLNILDDGEQIHECRHWCNIPALKSSLPCRGIGAPWED